MLIAALASAVLIEAAALGLFPIAIPHVLLAAILIAARGPLLPLLIVVAFLIRHVSLPPRPRHGGRVVAGSTMWFGPVPIEDASDMPRCDHR